MVVKRDTKNDFVEAGFLGGLLRNPDLVVEIKDSVDPQDFGNPVYSAIYATILDANDFGAMPTPSEVYGANLRIVEAGRTKRWPKNIPWPLESKALPQILFDLHGQGTSASCLERDALLIRDFGVRRRISQLGTEMRHMAEVSISGEDALEQLRSKVAQIELAFSGSNETDFRTDVLAAVDRIENYSNSGINELHWGIGTLDQATIGMRPGTLNIVAARPSVGKTALMLALAYNIASTGQPVLIFSLEQSRAELIERLIAMVAKVNLRRIQLGHASDNEYLALSQAANQIADMPFFVLESTHSTIGKVISYSRKYRGMYGVECVFVDYLQLMTGGERGTPRHEQVASFSRQLKLLAGELKLPIVALCQLNRESEKRADEKPKMSDLRESGAIEQDADCIILLHRLKPETGQPDGVDYVDALIEKQRNGPTGLAELRFTRNIMLYSER